MPRLEQLVLEYEAYIGEWVLIHQIQLEEQVLFYRGGVAKALRIPQTNLATTFSEYFEENQESVLLRSHKGTHASGF